MENTRENELRFKAQYFMADVIQIPRISKEGTNMVYLPLTIHFLQDLADKGFPIWLKPLSQIAKEEKIEVATIMGYTNDRLEKGAGIVWSGVYVTDAFKMWDIQDYLRSKGYALPYMGISVEQLQEYGWIKLKQ